MNPVRLAQFSALGYTLIAAGLISDSRLVTAIGAGLTIPLVSAAALFVARGIAALASSDNKEK